MTGVSRLVVSLIRSRHRAKIPRNAVETGRPCPRQRSNGLALLIHNRQEDVRGSGSKGVSNQSAIRRIVAHGGWRIVIGGEALGGRRPAKSEQIRRPRVEEMSAFAHYFGAELLQRRDVVENPNATPPRCYHQVVKVFLYR